MELFPGASLGFFTVIIWSKFVYFSKKHCKHGGGFSTFFFEEKLRAQILMVIIWSKLAIFLDPKLGPDNNPCLDQIIRLLIRPILSNFSNRFKQPLRHYKTRYLRAF